MSQIIKLSLLCIFVLVIYSTFRFFELQVLTNLEELTELLFYS